MSASSWHVGLRFPSDSIRGLTQNLWKSTVVLLQQWWMLALWITSKESHQIQHKSFNLYSITTWCFKSCTPLASWCFFFSHHAIYAYGWCFNPKPNQALHYVGTIFSRIKTMTLLLLTLWFNSWARDVTWNFTSMLRQMLYSKWFTLFSRYAWIVHGFPRNQTHCLEIVSTTLYQQSLRII